MRKDALLLLLPLFHTPVAVSQDDVQEDLGFAYGGEETISIATGYEQPISTAPAVATVITEEEIRQGGARFLSEVLEWVPGVHSSLSSIRFSPIISIRGIYTDRNPQVLVLINGVPLNQLIQGDRGINNDLPVEFIKRIEIVRGPGSAVYGADAFAGVVNIVTKTARDLEGGEGGLRLGSFDTIDGWVNYGRSGENLDYAFSLQYHGNDTDGDRVIDADAQSVFDSAFGTSASLAPGAVNVDQERIDTRFNIQTDRWDVNWYSRHQNQGGGPGLAQALDPTGEGSSDDYLLDAAFKHDASKNWRMTYRGYYYRVEARSEQRLFPPGAVLPIGQDGNLGGEPPLVPVSFPDGMIGNPGFDEDQLSFEATGIYDGFKDNTVRFAAGVKWQRFEGRESKNFGPGSTIDPPTPPLDISTAGDVIDVTGTENVFIGDESRRLIFASVQDEIALSNTWDLTVGARWDSYSDFGDTINPRIAAVWRATPKLTSKFLYGRAFRAPSFTELYQKNNPVANGNTDLDPEVINTVEVALAYDVNPRLHLGLDIYYYEINDAIEFVDSVAQNVGNFNGSGVDLEVSYQATRRLALSGFVSFLRTENEDSGGEVPGAPETMALAQIAYQFPGGWLLDAKAKYVGDRPRAEGDPREQIDDYTWGALTIRRFARAKGLEVALGIKNLFDEDAREPSPFSEDAPQGALIPGDYPLSSRHFFGEVLYKF